MTLRIIILGLLLIVTLTLFYDQKPQPSPPQAKAPQKQPIRLPFRATGVTIIDTNRDGDVIRKVTSPIMQHNRDHSVVTMETPRTFLISKESQWEISSLRSTMLNQQLINMTGDVTLQQHSRKNELTLKTPELTIDLEMESAYSLKPTTLTFPGLNLKSGGVDLDFKQPYIEFSKGVKSHYVL